MHLEMVCPCWPWAGWRLVLDGAGTEDEHGTEMKLGLGLLPHITQPGAGTAGFGGAGRGAALCWGGTGAWPCSIPPTVPQPAPRTSPRAARGPAAAASSSGQQPPPCRGGTLGPPGVCPGWGRCLSNLSLRCLSNLSLRVLESALLPLSCAAHPSLLPTPKIPCDDHSALSALRDFLRPCAPYRGAPRGAAEQPFG